MRMQSVLVTLEYSTMLKIEAPVGRVAFSKGLPLLFVFVYRSSSAWFSFLGLARCPHFGRLASVVSAFAPPPLARGNLAPRSRGLSRSARTVASYASLGVPLVCRRLHVGFPTVSGRVRWYF